MALRTPTAGAADGTLPEKVAQQSVRLPGDFLQTAAAQLDEEGVTVAATAATAARWGEASELVLRATVQHGSPLLRAAAQGVIAGLSPAAYGTLPLPLQQQLLGWCCSAAGADEASPVRAAAVKALGAVAAATALCTVPKGDLALADG